MRSLARRLAEVVLPAVGLLLAPAAAGADEPPSSPAAPTTAAPAPPSTPTVASPRKPAPRAATSPTLLAPLASPAPPSGGSTGAALDDGIGRARELLARAKLLDESAANDEKLAADLTKAIPALRAAAKSARERVSRPDAAARPDHDALLARAEELEAELAVDEIDVAVKKHTAASNRRVASELRAVAVRVAREPAPLAEADAQNPCDPPYRYTADGRKIYRVECF